MPVRRLFECEGCGDWWLPPVGLSVHKPGPMWQAGWTYRRGTGLEERLFCVVCYVEDARPADVRNMIDRHGPAGNTAISVPFQLSEVLTRRPSP